MTEKHVCRWSQNFVYILHIVLSSVIIELILFFIYYDLSQQSQTNGL